MLARASQGLFSQLEVNRGLPTTLLAKYFHPRGTEWQLHDTVRAMVEFRQLNLIEPWPPTPAWDVVFLRNVLIYFDVATKKMILGKLRDCLKPDGYLFLGSAETVASLDNGYERCPFGTPACFASKAPQGHPV